MTVAEYYNHARTLGAFRAVDCIALAREAARLDEEAKAKAVCPPGQAWHEALPDGSARISLTAGVLVF